MAGERRLLVARERGERHGRAEERGLADDLGRADDAREHGARDAEEGEQLVVPRVGRESVEQRP